MKSIILAAGMGTRLDKYTKTLPKCMLNFNGKTLIERQVETLRACGINEIVIVTGYMKDKIKIKNADYCHNANYASTNMVASLMCAGKELNDGILVCYGDILYEKRIAKQVIEAPVDIGVAVDIDYLDYWKARLGKKWQEDTESLVIGKDGSIVEVGVPDCPLSKANFRYVGLIKFSEKGIAVLKKLYNKSKRIYWGKDERFMNSRSFKKLYMTDMLQLIINSGQKVYPVPIKHGWMEFDTNEDYEKAIKWVKNKSIRKFYNPE
ncbi:phosphocholine cytidylyltransferase family protein [Candidatus Woesearchaeota archaeon]|nr:phosphocholine cytidylyltransferase family protein [Candidatus Woesearchaeota archaeon]